jgi:hypothetical protein
VSSETSSRFFFCLFELSMGKVLKIDPLTVKSKRPNGEKHEDTSFEAICELHSRATHR